MVTEGSERPLKANIILLSIFVLDKLIVFLIDRVVCQVHVAVVLVELC